MTNFSLCLSSGWLSAPGKSHPGAISSGSYPSPAIFQQDVVHGDDRLHDQHSWIRLLQVWSSADEHHPKHGRLHNASKGAIKNEILFHQANPQVHQHHVIWKMALRLGCPSLYQGSKNLSSNTRQGGSKGKVLVAKVAVKLEFKSPNWQMQRNALLVVFEVVPILCVSDFCERERERERERRLWRHWYHAEIASDHAYDYLDGAQTQRVDAFWVLELRSACQCKDKELGAWALDWAAGSSDWWMKMGKWKLCVRWSDCRGSPSSISLACFNFKQEE